MAKDERRMLSDTMFAIQQSQLERERQHKLSERESANKVIERIAKRNDWTKEDLAEVRGALGLGGEDEQT